MVIALVWGSTWLAIRLGLDSITPFIAAGARFFIASFIVLVIMKFRGIKLQLDAVSVKLYIVLGLFSFVVPFGLVYWAEQYIPSGLASIVFAALPFFIIIFSKLINPDEKIFFNQFMGVAIGFAGIVVIFSENISFSFHADFLGVAAVLLSAAMQAVIGVVIKKYGSHLNPLSMNYVPLLMSGIILIIFAAFTENTAGWNLDAKTVLSILYLAVFGTVVAFTTYYWLLKKINIVILSLNAFITPIIAVILGWIVLSEKLSVRTLAGSSLVLIGILFTNFRGIKKYYQSRYRKFNI